MVMNLDYKVKKLRELKLKAKCPKWPKSLYGLKDEVLLSLVKYDIQVAKKISFTACSLGKL